jgi:hypothetical protein
MKAEASGSGLFRSPVVGGRRPGRILHTILVLCAASSLAAHGWIAVTGGHGQGFSLVMAAMSVMCLPCVVGLVRSPHDMGPVRMVLGMSVVMVLLHVLAITLGAGTMTTTHDLKHFHPASGPAPTGAAGSVGRGGHTAMMFSLIVLELVVAALASCRLRPPLQKAVGGVGGDGLVAVGGLQRLLCR